MLFEQEPDKTVDKTLDKCFDKYRFQRQDAESEGFAVKGSFPCTSIHISVVSSVRTHPPYKQTANSPEDPFRAFRVFRGWGFNR